MLFRRGGDGGGCRGFGRFGLRLRGGEALRKAVLADVLAVFVHADGQERNDHDRDAEIAAVTIAVLDDVREAGHGNGHGQNDDERGHDGAAHRRGLDAAEHRQLLKAGNEAEDRRHARRDEAEHEADAVNRGERADAHGVAASDPLPLGRYFVTEVSAPAYYQINSEKMEAEIEYPGQIIKLSQYDKPAKLGVTIKKSGNLEVQPGTTMRYDLSGIANTSNVALNNFYWHDRLPTDATNAMSLTTGTYNQRLYYRITFKTNVNDYRVLASNLLTSNNYSVKLSAAALGLVQGEYVTDIRFEFGTVASGFSSVTKPTIQVQVKGTLSDGYQIINRSDVGGQYLNEWQTATSNWVTIVRRFQPVTPLPKTGY